MTYSAAALLTLASQCAPTVAPETVLAIVRTESHEHPFALGVNGARQPTPRTNAVDAAAAARRYIAAGYSVDLGLGQINSRNMRALGLTWETVFDPCTNIAALGQLLTQSYNVAKPGRDPQSALRVAFSLYNSGSTSRGFRNGYVAKVVSNVGVAVALTADAGTPPASETSTHGDAREIIVAENTMPQPMILRRRPAPPPAWNVFERAAYDRETPNEADGERTDS
jgi:type IV secretion system protein VirB1